jgi:hypothetical protein
MDGLLKMENRLQFELPFNVGLTLPGRNRKSPPVDTGGLRSGLAIPTG